MANKWMDGFKKVLGAVAPIAASALPGPFGPMVIGMIGKGLGVPEGSSEDAIAEAVATANPEQMLALKQVELELEKFLESAQIEKAKLEGADRADARQREIAVRDNTPKVLAYLVTAMFGGLMAALFFLDVPDKSRDVLNQCAGILGTLTVATFTFYFGSSSSSRAKDATISAMSK